MVNNWAITEPDKIGVEYILRELNEERHSVRVPTARPNLCPACDGEGCNVCEGNGRVSDATLFGGLNAQIAAHNDGCPRRVFTDGVCSCR